MSIEAMKQALEALRKARRKILTTEECHAAITSLRQAIEQAEKQEPVAWKTDDIELYVREDKFGFYNIPLYTTPQPQREWVGLTDGEMRELEKQFEAERVRTSDEEYLIIYPAAYWQWQRAIEAKLKEKNT